MGVPEDNLSKMAVVSACCRRVRYTWECLRITSLGSNVLNKMAAATLKLAKSVVPEDNLTWFHSA